MEKQHPYMSQLHVFVRLYFSSLLRSLRHKLWWKYSYFTSYIVIKIFFISLYVHYVVIKTKNIIFLVNNKINFATTFTTPGSRKIHIFISMPLLLRSLQRDSDKKIFSLSLLLFFLLHPRLLLPSPCLDQDNSFFHFFTTFMRLDQKEK